MNKKMKAVTIVAILCIGTCVFAGPHRKHHHNDGLELANGIVDLVCRVIAPTPTVVVAPAPAPVVVTPAPAVVVTPPPPPPRPIVVQPAPVYYTRPTPPRPRPTPPPRPAHRGGRPRR